MQNIWQKSFLAKKHFLDSRGAHVATPTPQANFPDPTKQLALRSLHNGKMQRVHFVYFYNMK